MSPLWYFALSLGPAAVVALTPMLDVRLSHVAGSQISLAITNAASAPIRLPKPNTIFDSLPVQKVHVSVDGKLLDFHGPRLLTNPELLSHQDFVTMAPGQTLTSVVDVAKSYDLPRGATVNVVASSSIPYAAAHSTRLAGKARYVSNTLSLKVDGTSSVAFKRSALRERSILPTDCKTPKDLESVTKAIEIARTWTTNAAKEAPKHNSKAWIDYFRFMSNDPAIEKEYHSVVTTRFERLAAELSATPKGQSRIHCQSSHMKLPAGEVDACAAYPNSTIAFTLKPSCEIALCPLYFSMPDALASCKGEMPHDKPMVFIHELAHCDKIGQVGLNPAPEDIAFNYKEIHDDTIMPAGWSVQNAQSYCLFAKAVSAAGDQC